MEEVLTRNSVAMQEYCSLQQITEKLPLKKFSRSSKQFNGRTQGTTQVSRFAALFFNSITIPFQMGVRRRQWGSRLE